MAKVCPLPGYAGVVRWTVQDVVNWLSENRLPDCVKKFREASVDGNKLLNITLSDMRNIQVNSKDARKILELVDQVQRPNDKRGQAGYNKNNFSSHNIQPDPDSDGEDDWGSDFEDEFDDDTPVALPRQKREGGRLPPPPPKSNGPPMPTRRAVPTPPPEETYEDPYQSRYPGSNQPTNTFEENYEDPNEPPPVVQRTKQFSRPVPKEPPRSRGAPSRPIKVEEPQEIYTEVDEEVEPPPPRHQRPKARPPSPEEPGVYEEAEEERKQIFSAKSPTRSNLPPIPATPDQEDYEEVDESLPAPRKPPHRAPAPPPSVPFIEQEVYEDVDEDTPAKVTPFKAAPTKAAPQKKATPPSRKALPPTPVEPEETYEIPDTDTLQEDEDYLEMDDKPVKAPSRPMDGDDYLDMEDSVDTAPPTKLAPRPPHSRPQIPVPVPQPEEQEVYEDVDEDTPAKVTPFKAAPTKAAPQKKATPPSRKGLPPTPVVPEEEENYVEPCEEPVRKSRPPPSMPREPPKREKTPPPKRALPTPPVPGYNHVVVTGRGVKIQNDDKDTQSNAKTDPAAKEGYLEAQRFYHGEITRNDADARLLQHRVDGMYLVRKSTKNANQPYTLQLYYQRETYNLPVYKNSKNHYTISSEPMEFPTIRDMVNHFKQYKLILKGGLETKLLKSLPKS